MRFGDNYRHTQHCATAAYPQVSRVLLAHLEILSLSSEARVPVHYRPVQPPVRRNGWRSGQCLWAVAICCAAVASGAAAAKAKVSSDNAKYDPSLIPGKTAFVSRYKPLPAPETVVRNARVLTGTGDDLERTDLLIKGGKIVRMGAELKVGGNALQIDASGKWVTPGLLDLGFGFEADAALFSGESSVSWSLPYLGQHRSEQVQALAGGVTTVLYSLFAGEQVSLGVVLRNLPGIDPLAALMPDAPLVLTLTCPSSPAGWDALQEELRQAALYRSGSLPYNRRLNLMAGALTGDITLHLRCGSAEAIAFMLEIVAQMKLKPAAMVEAAEAYKFATRLVGMSICTSFPVGLSELHNIRGEVNVLAAPLLDAVSRKASCAIVQTRGAEDIGQLNLLAGRARAQAAAALKLQVPSARAISWITTNPARALRVVDKVGQIAVGRAADLVVWSGDPFSAYSRAEKVLMDGALVWDLEKGGRLQRLDADVRAQAQSVREEAAAPRANVPTPGSVRQGGGERP